MKVSTSLIESSTYVSLVTGTHSGWPTCPNSRDSAIDFSDTAIIISNVSILKCFSVATAAIPTTPVAIHRATK